MQESLVSVSVYHHGDKQWLPLRVMQIIFRECDERKVFGEIEATVTLLFCGEDRKSAMAFLTDWEPFTSRTEPFCSV